LAAVWEGRRSTGSKTKWALIAFAQTFSDPIICSTRCVNQGQEKVEKKWSLVALSTVGQALCGCLVRRGENGNPDPPAAATSQADRYREQYWPDPRNSLDLNCPGSR
jgi:hypothetical protein